MTKRNNLNKTFKTFDITLMAWGMYSTAGGKSSKSGNPPSCSLLENSFPPGGHGSKKFLAYLLLSTATRYERRHDLPSRGLLRKTEQTQLRNNTNKHREIFMNSSKSKDPGSQPSSVGSLAPPVAILKSSFMTFPMPQSPLLKKKKKKGNTTTHLTSCCGESSKITNTECLAHKKSSTNVSCCYHTSLIFVFTARTTAPTTMATLLYILPHTLKIRRLPGCTK